MQLLPLYVTLVVMVVCVADTRRLPLARKLKCDGGRPACAQCIKRSNPCDYQPQNNKRRSTHRSRKHSDSESDMISGDDPSADPSLSPEIPAHTAPRKSSNVERRTNLDAF